MLRLQVRASHSETIIHRGEGGGSRISGMHAGFKALLCSQSKSETINIVLPKLHHCTGEVRSVRNGVVCVTLVCIPWVVARAPWQFLKNKHVYSCVCLSGSTSPSPSYDSVRPFYPVCRMLLVLNQVPGTVVSYLQW